ncbi:fluoride efflux transporter CrcB [Providencia hangzhouensis]|mgnify:FL=1|uniref:Fluoride-specific ion channel FluC n=1 Tax=Providencia rettgeri TaxID=587 RepID=A0AAE3CYD4_PRORE|nr:MULTISPECIES: fluoride efflux transporter CrcB [Providencia]MRF66708.1 fluoride efflux transporter CrcB [Escherichia coli]EFE54815.1 protein CrcB [Providencia rettgeri DSM 1131]EHZ6871191.1 fluoride efflux transporter CrcB [Providencia rettgeri]MBG5891794.1 fluoride efflux transporter CrcB [Providencia rettgeri]MBG5928239.1 fluoride efflux transporter CrcB [Providencia rettgeri]
MVAIDILLVGSGGGIGSLLRWWIGRLVGERYHGTFPLSTFIINISGAFVIGFLSRYFAIDWDDRYGTFLQSAVLTGLLGGYTTFSSMQLDALKLTQTKQKLLALFYLLLSVLFGLAAAFIGAWLAN